MTRHFIVLTDNGIWASSTNNCGEAWDRMTIIQVCFSGDEKSGNCAAELSDVCARLRQISLAIREGCWILEGINPQGI